LLIVLFGLLGCSQLTNLTRSPIAEHFFSTQIGDLEPTKNIDANIRLKGKITSVAPFLKGGAYQLEDSTGKIWVTTATKLPAKGEEVAIEAKVQYQSIAIENQEWGEIYAIELKQNP
jgi:hypothetical protein